MNLVPGCNERVFRTGERHPWTGQLRHSFSLRPIGNTSIEAPSEPCAGLDLGHRKSLTVLGVERWPTSADECSQAIRSTGELKSDDTTKREPIPGEPFGAHFIRH